MATQNSLSVVGAGLRYPFQFGRGKGLRSASVADGLEKINGSIRTILTTRPGERYSQPEFGSRIADLLFEPQDDPTRYLLQFYTAEALRRWEPRIRVTSVSVSFVDDHGISSISIEYEVLKTHQIGSYVFPFTRNSMPMAEAVTGVESRRIFTQGTVLPAGA